jgi:glutathione S-transferase
MKANFDWATALRPAMRSVVRFAKAEGASRIGVLGYCFGAMVTTLVAAEEPAVCCMVVSHPSLHLLEKAFGGAPPEAMAAAARRVPTLLQPAGDDHPTYKDGGATLAAFRDAARGGRLESTAATFPEMRHGFVLRGNTADAAVGRDVRRAVDGTVAFFREHLIRSPPRLRLTYFSMPGRAETTRLALTVGGVAFEDVRVTAPEWAEIKRSAEQNGGDDDDSSSSSSSSSSSNISNGSTTSTKNEEEEEEGEEEKKVSVLPALRQLPLLEINGQEICQSKAINRLAGKLAGLYPADPFLAAQVDMVLDTLDDRLQLFQPSFSIRDRAERVAVRRQITESLEQGSNRFRTITVMLDDRLANAEDGFVVGPTLTVADLALFSDHSALCAGWLDGVDASTFEGRYPHLTAHRNRIANLPAVKKYYAAAAIDDDPLRRHFRPDPITVGYWSMQGLGAPLRMMVMFAQVPLRVVTYKLREKREEGKKGEEEERKAAANGTDDAVGVKTTTTTSVFEATGWYKHTKPLLKAKNPLMNLPYVLDGLGESTAGEVPDSVVVAQSNACLAYLGRKFGLWGTTAAEEIECEELLCEVADLRAALTDFSYRRPGPRQSAAAAALDTATTAVEAAAFLEKVGGKHGALQKFDQKLAAATAKSLVGRSSASGGSFLVGGHATAPVREPMMIII